MSEKSLILLLAGVFTGLLAGCAAGPKYPPYAGKDAACVRDDVRFTNTFSPTKAQVTIKEIDGVPTVGPRDEPYCMPGGKHRFGVRASTDFYESQDYVDIELAPGRSYWLRANIRGISHVFELMDVTEKTEVKAFEFSLKAQSGGQQLMVPIFVPRR